MAFFLFRISVEGHFSESTPHHRHACTSFEISVVSLVGSKQRHRTCDFCFRCAFGTLGRTCSGWPKNCWRWRTRLRTIWNSRKRSCTVRRSWLEWRCCCSPACTCWVSCWVSGTACSTVFGGTCLTSSRSRLSSSLIGSKWRPWKRRHLGVRTLSRISWRQRRLSGTIREYRSCLPTLPWTIPFIGQEWGQRWSQDSPSVCGPMTTRESGWRRGARYPRLVTWREHCLAGWACPWSWRSTPSSTSAFSSYSSSFCPKTKWIYIPWILATCPCFRPSWSSAMKRIVLTCFVTFECVWLQVLTFGSRRVSWPCRGNRAVASRRRTSWFRCSSPWAVRSTASSMSSKIGFAPSCRMISATQPQVIGV